MYFETGQEARSPRGASRSGSTHASKARAYGVARSFQPFWSTAVVVFRAGVLYDERQIIRVAGDHFMGSCWPAHGLDVATRITLLPIRTQPTTCCYSCRLQAATTSWAFRVSDDVMLNYQSTSYQDALARDASFHLRSGARVLAWLQALDLSLVMNRPPLDSSAADVN